MECLHSLLVFKQWKHSREVSFTAIKYNISFPNKVFAVLITDTGDFKRNNISCFAVFNITKDSFKADSKSLFSTIYPETTLNEAMELAIGF